MFWPQESKEDIPAHTKNRILSMSKYFLSLIPKRTSREPELKTKTSVGSTSYFMMERDPPTVPSSSAVVRKKSSRPKPATVNPVDLSRPAPSSPSMMQVADTVKTKGRKQSMPISQSTYVPRSSAASSLMPTTRPSPTFLSEPLPVLRTQSSKLGSASSFAPAPAPAAAPAPAPASAAASSSGAKPLCCDKCDGKHETDDCPFYKKKREDHPDAQKNFYKKMGGTSTLPGAMIRMARIVRQPGDGSCLFHSMSYGLKERASAATLRTEICSFIQQNPSFKICDTPLSDWVRWDSGTTCTEYARRMSRGAWGGGIEMACLSQIKGVNVHVYEQVLTGFKRISAFDHPDSPERRHTVRVLYCGGVHYEALVA